MTAPEHLPALAFPAGRPLATRRQRGAWQVLDPVRRRYVRLSPEEWVRQHLVRTLVEHLGYPLGLIALEPTIATAGGLRRPDVVAFDRDGQPALIAECKAPRVRIGQDVFEQVSRYNVVARAAALVVTNGEVHYCWRVDRDAGTLRFLEAIPPYRELRP